MTYLTHFLCLMIGAFLGMLVTALCVAAKNSDQIVDELVDDFGADLRFVYRNYTTPLERYEFHQEHCNQGCKVLEHCIDGKRLYEAAAKDAGEKRMGHYA